MQADNQANTKCLYSSSVKHYIYDAAVVVRHENTGHNPTNRKNVKGWISSNICNDDEAKKEKYDDDTISKQERGISTI